MGECEGQTLRPSWPALMAATYPPGPPPTTTTSYSTAAAENSRLHPEEGITRKGRNIARTFGGQQLPRNLMSVKGMPPVKGPSSIVSNVDMRRRGTPGKTVGLAVPVTEEELMNHASRLADSP